MQVIAFKGDTIVIDKICIYYKESIAYMVLPYKNSNTFHKLYKFNYLCGTRKF